MAGALALVMASSGCLGGAELAPQILDGDGGLRACGASGASGGFCDATSLWGVDLTLRTRSREGMATVMSVADVDGDGRTDLLLGFDSARPMMVFLNRGGRFERGAGLGLDDQRRVVATATGDLDGDGDADLLLHSRSERGVRLLRNDGGVFTLAGRLDAGEDISAITLHDVDGDGRLDVVAASAARSGACRLPFISGCPEGVLSWRQPSAWTFTPMPVTAGPRRALAIRWHDVDDDGVDELVVAADFGMLNGGNQVLRVRGEGADTRLEEATPAGLDVQVFGMGVAPIDVDEDGVDEVMITNFGCNALLRRGRSGWVDVARRVGADAYGEVVEGGAPEFTFLDPENAWMGPLARFRDRYLEPDSPRAPTTKWVPLVFDYDQDGHDDVYVAAAWVGLSALFPEPSLQSGTLLRGDGERLDEVTAAVGLLDRHGAHAPVAADLDGDGDLDLAMVRVALDGHPGGLVLLRNDAARGASLTVRARGRDAMRDGVGARVTAVVGGRRMRRRVDGNLSIAGSGLHLAHFGLGDATRVEHLEVRFPSGAVRTLYDVPAGEVTVEE